MVFSMTNARRKQDGTITTRQGPRRFTLIDAMMFIVAIAVGLAIIRYSQKKYFAWWEPEDRNRLIYYTLYWIGRLGYGMLPVVFGLCVVVVAAAFGGSCPRRETFSRSPGLAACAAALVAILIGFAFRVLDYTVGQSGAFWSRHYESLCWPTLDRQIVTAYNSVLTPPAVDRLLQDAGGAAMSAVVAVWFLQLLCGLWKQVREWPDRIGRVLGLFFLLWMLTPH
jgi:hypothetical protein